MFLLISVVLNHATGRLRSKSEGFTGSESEVKKEAEAEVGTALRELAQFPSCFWGEAGTDRDKRLFMLLPYDNKGDKLPAKYCLFTLNMEGGQPMQPVMIDVPAGNEKMAAAVVEAQFGVELTKAMAGFWLGDKLTDEGGTAFFLIQSYTP